MIANINQSIANEVARATSAETSLGNLIEAVDDKVDQEIAGRIADVDEEETRAKAAETALQNAITAEVTRATGAEEALSDRISAIESGSTQALEEEIARAEAAEAALDAKIDAEKTRALSAETDLLDVIEDEITNRKANAVASVEYELSGTTHVINFYNANNAVIDTIDATDFIKDGMIDSVSLETTGGTTYLVIVWNTDAGKETTRIDIGDLFDADNYYTKAETDAAIAVETTRATSEETALHDALDAEISARTAADTAEATARQNADVVSMAVGATAGITLTLGNGSTIVATEAEEITLTAGEF